MKITQATMAKLANVTRQTIINWQKTKPELIRLLLLGIKNDERHLVFFDLFKGKKKTAGDELWKEDAYFIDFYFRFLLFFSSASTRIGDAYAQYLIRKNKDELFDPCFNIRYDDHSLLTSDSFLKPFLNIGDEVSDYILKNTQDDFETLINDTIYKDSVFFKNAILISISYFVYRAYPDMPHHDKQIKINALVDNVDFHNSNREQVIQAYIDSKVI